MPLSLRLADVDTRRRANLAVALSGVLFFAGLVYVVRLVIQGHAAPAVAVIAACAVLTLATPLVLRRTASVVIAGNQLALALMLCVGGISVLTAGHSAAALFDLSLVPMVAILIAGRRSGAVWAGIVGVQLVVAHVMIQAGMEPLYDLASDIDACGVFVGTAAPGDSCAYDVDCAPQPDSYTKCNTIDVNGGRKCGSAAWLAAGKACSTITNDATHQCGPGLYCDIAMGAQFGKCITQPRKMPGEACTDPGDCVSFDCKAGVCADTGTTHLLWNSVRCGVAQH